jgi:hypothetical protein
MPASAGHEQSLSGQVRRLIDGPMIAVARLPMPLILIRYTLKPGEVMCHACAQVMNRKADIRCQPPKLPAIVQRHDARFEPCRGHKLQAQ